MRYAIFSDVHANFQAWQAIRQDMEALEADVLVCLGDVVGYGPRPEEVLRAIREVTPNFVLGNHDAVAAGLIEPSLFNPHARAAIEWTRRQLTRKSRDFLSEVPLKLESNDLLFVHAEISSPERFGYIDNAKDAQANFSSNKHFATFIGHTHHPAVFDLDPGLDNGKHAYRLPDEDCQLVPTHRYIINVGSVGEPRNPDDIRARYVIYDSDSRDLYFRRVPFDPDAYRRDLAATSLTQLPYFLQVLEHHAALEAEAFRAMTIDMQMPMASPHYVEQFYHGAAPQQLYIPTGIDPGLAKPKPMPSAEHRKLRTKYAAALVLALLLLTAIGVVAYYSWIGNSERRKRNGEVARSNSGVALAASHPSGVSPPGPEAGTPPTAARTGTPGSPEADPVQPIESAKTGVEPARIDLDPKQPGKQPGQTVPVIPPAPGSAPPQAPPLTTSPGTEPDPIPAPGPVSKVLAKWRMNRDSAGPVLLDELGNHSLHQKVSGRVIAGLAPDPVPLTGEPNKSAMALGVWVEPKPSTAFRLTADRSFTFEGWLMTNKTKKPIFIGGTRPGEEGRGWRLDVRAAKNERARGSMRFFYQGATEPVTVVNQEIELYDPGSHHFAVVWDHQGGSGPDKGRITLYYDGAKLAESDVSHKNIATGEEGPFQLGAGANPGRVALDEVRYTAEALHPGDFLNLGLGPDAIGALAFMIDVGPHDKLYDGVDSPGHADREIPKTFTSWIDASHESEQFAQTRSVQQANGEIYPLPLTIDLGLTDAAKIEGGIVWAEKNVLMESVMENQRGLFAIDLMDRFYDPEGKRGLGLRVRGFEKGRYQVYFTPFGGGGTRAEHVFGVGVDLASAPGEIRSLDSESMQKRTYSARKATPNDGQWFRDRNYFSQEVEVTGPRDYVVVIVAGSKAAAIPYLQIVKKGSSSLPRTTPIEYRFDGGSLSNQAVQVHPLISRISEMKSTGFNDGPMTAEPGGDGDGGFVLAGTVNNPGAEMKDHFHFSFAVSDTGARLDGFSMETSGPQKLFREVSLHQVQDGQVTGPKLADLMASSPVPAKLSWEAVGSLAGEEALRIHLDPGSYEIRIAGMDTDGAKRLTVDNVRVDFSRE